MYVIRLLCGYTFIGLLAAGCSHDRQNVESAQPDSSLEKKSLQKNAVIKSSPSGDALVFADANLGACVKSSWDKNKDGVLQKTEAEKVTSLWCGGKAIRSMEGIELLPNLEHIYCSGNQMGTMPKFSALKKLKVLRCTNNYFSDADCIELAAIRANGVATEIEKQADGRILTCDMVKLVGHVQNGEFRAKTKDGDNHLNDVWGFTHEGMDYVAYGTITDIHIYRVQSMEPHFEEAAVLPRGEKDAKMWEQPNHSIWSEVRYYAHEGKAYLYVSSEGNRNQKDGVLPYLQLWDITNLKEPKEIKIAKEDLHEGLNSLHNITLNQDAGLLVGFGGRQEHAEKDKRGRKPSWKGARIYDISKDPTKPEFIMHVGKLYVHDGQLVVHKNEGDVVEDIRLYMAHGSTAIHWDATVITNKENRIGIYDITSLREDDIKVLVDQQYPFGYSHNIWATEDETHIIMTGETPIENQLSFWRLRMKTEENKDCYTESSDEATMCADFRNGINLQGGSMAHNAFVVGNHIYASHYSKGVQVAEIYEALDGKRIRLKWSYDTFPWGNGGDFEGSWGVYPFSNAKDLFFATDISTGLYIFKKSERFMNEEETQ